MPLICEELPFNFQNPLAFIQSFHPLQGQFIFQGFSFLTVLEENNSQFLFKAVCTKLTKHSTTPHKIHVYTLVGRESHLPAEGELLT